MQEASCWFYLDIATNVSFFVLFCIKAYGAIIKYVIPFLEKRRQETDERWFALQEKHMVLVAKKKQLATQFLQQEKQIALLTAKLEAWHLICSNKQRERERAITEREELMNVRAALQQQMVAKRQLVAQTVEKILKETEQQARQEAELLFPRYMHRAQQQLSTIQKKETLYESSYAKKTEST